MAAIAEREREMSDLIEQIVSSSEDSIKSRMVAMRVAAKAKLKDLRGLLGGDVDVAVARAALLKHVSQIEMEPQGKSYIAKGNWNLLGMRPIDGAGGQNRTLGPTLEFQFRILGGAQHRLIENIVGSSIRAGLGVAASCDRRGLKRRHS